jgi:hypothetical protein
MTNIFYKWFKSFFVYLAPARNFIIFFRGKEVARSTTKEHAEVWIRNMIDDMTATMDVGGGAKRWSGKKASYRYKQVRGTFKIVHRR